MADGVLQYFEAGAALSTLGSVLLASEWRCWQPVEMDFIRWRPNQARTARFQQAVVGFLILCAFAVADEPTQAPHGTATERGSVPVAPGVVYVADFDLQVANIQTDSGRPMVLESRGIPEVRPNRRRVTGTKDRDALARELVDGLATSLVQALGRSGVDARRIASNTEFPKSGWLVRGVFLEVDEGNRLRRAVVGFGSGKTELQVQATVDRLTNGPPRPYYQLSSQAASKSSPGAVVLLNPVMAAVRFSRADGDLHRNVQETADQLASGVVELIRRPVTPDSTSK